jgi:methionine-rich copper-binding protein CopC
MTKTWSSALLAAFLLLVVAGTALAHGGLEGSDPEEGARLDKPPRRVTMAFSEIPARDSVLKVIDGCKRNVVTGTSVVGSDLVGEVGDAQPGAWKASYRVISAEDGHLTRGTLSFTVKGKKDCNPDDDGGKGKPSEEPTDSGDGGTATPPGDDGGSFPVVPVAVGAAGLVIVGLVVRRASGP